jgi:hypothetical protein
VSTPADKIVFLDSDVLCLRDFGDPDCLRTQFAAKPADLRTFAAAADVWQPLYAAAGVALPGLSLPTTVSGEFGLPYFNSGVIAVDNGLDFGRAWIDCARAIGNTPPMPGQRHWLDQVSLPLAVHKLGLSYSALDERFNHPAHLKPLSGELPFLCHYHWPRIVRREPVLHGLVRELAHAHPLIAQVMAREPEWAALLDPGAHVPLVEPAELRPAAPATTQILVAGIPASGADELLEALAGHGCSVARDPPEVTSVLGSSGPPWELAAFAQNAQVHGGAPAARITAIGSDLRLLCRLDAIGRVLPRARAVVCVRNPYDTIAAWKAQPRERFDAALAWVAASGRHCLGGAAWAQFERLAAVTDICEKRAAWWWWLAQRALDHSGDATIVRYEDLAADPAGVLHAVLEGSASAPLGKSAAPTADAALDEHDRQAIRAICLQPAAELGVAGC